MVLGEDQNGPGIGESHTSPPPSTSTPDPSSSPLPKPPELSEIFRLSFCTLFCVGSRVAVLAALCGDAVPTVAVSRRERGGEAHTATAPKRRREEEEKVEGVVSEGE